MTLKMVVWSSPQNVEVYIDNRLVVGFRNATVARNVSLPGLYDVKMGATVVGYICSPDEVINKGG